MKKNKPYTLLNKAEPYLWIAPSVILMCIFIIVPIGTVFRMAFSEVSKTGKIRGFAGFDNFTKVLETEDKEEALMDLARLYERMVMRRHTNGGYQNVVDEMWRQVEDWRAEIIIMYQNVACKNMATLQGILDDTCRDRNHHMIWIEHDLMDPRTVSRKTMRDKVNEYMRTVMKAEPVDPTLCDFDDELGM